MTRYFCDKCGAEIARGFDIESVTFTMESGTVCGDPIIVQVHKELCFNCMSKATKEFKDLINNM